MKMLLQKVKLALRIKHNAFDDDIQDLIDAAKTDLQISGIKTINEVDPLIIQAVKVYCKANFGDNTNSEKFKQSYESLKTHLALCGDYND